MRRFVLAFAAFLLGAVPVSAQDWPGKAVKIIVPFGPGSTPDLIVRMIADHLQKKHAGSTFVVENKAGAGGNIGTDAVAKAEPDGATIGLSILGPLAINPLLLSNMPYDPAKDIALVTMLTSQPSVIAVHASLNVKSVGELVALLRREPGKYNYGSIGNGSLSHLAMEAVALASGTKLVHIPYTSSPQAMTALLRGDVHIACLPAIAVTPQVASGNVAILAVTTDKRSRYLPEIPTLKEAGIDVEADAWNGMVAPARTPDAVIAQIQREVAEALTSSEIRAKLAAQYIDPTPTSPAQFRARIDADIARWSPVIKAANIRIN